MKRQNVRKITLLIALLLFPITMWYFSPYLIIRSAMSHIINGSFIVFFAMLIISMFFGRFFCAYLCPMGGMQECIAAARDKKTSGKGYISKYIIWGLWISSIIVCYILGKGSLTVDFLYQTDHGISISQIGCYIIYYGVIILMFAPALIFGKRFACHYFCWMAPFMIIGSKLGRALHLPQLKVKGEPDKCINCGKCSKQCPMSIDVKEVMKSGVIKTAECINCGACVDSCPKKALHYTFKNIKEVKKECPTKIKMPI